MLENNWQKALLIGAAVIIIGLIQFFWPKYPADNPVQEVAQEVIKEETGLNVELTPLTIDKA